MSGYTPTARLDGALSVREREATMNDQLDATDLWIGAHYWDSAARPKMTLGELLTRSEVCVASITGGGLDDLHSLGLLGRHGDTKQWMHWGHAWADRAILDLRPSIADDLIEFAISGELTLVDDLMTEANPEIVEICQRLQAAELLPEKNGIGMYPDGAASIVDALIEAGLDIENIQAIHHGFELRAAGRDTPAKLKNQTLVHCDQRIMRWCVNNAKAMRFSTGTMVSNTNIGPARTCPLFALLTATTLMRQNPIAYKTPAAETGTTDHA